MRVAAVSCWVGVAAVLNPPLSQTLQVDHNLVSSCFNVMDALLKPYVRAEGV